MDESEQFGKQQAASPEPDPSPRPSPQPETAAEVHRVGERVAEPGEGDRFMFTGQFSKEQDASPEPDPSPRPSPQPDSAAEIHRVGERVAELGEGERFVAKAALREGHRVLPALWFVCAALLGGCRAMSPWPPANLEAPGWSVRQGQAVWTAAKGAQGVAGELLLATRSGGECFVQFAKPPFTLATARAEAGGWSVELASARRQFRGRGKVPVRFVWFALAAEIRGQPVGGGWRFERRGGTEWRLAHSHTGEVLEGYLAP